MKRFAATLLLLCLSLSLCACGEAEKPEEIADVPNIDHNILDADRHLGNSYENYSSEDTLLVEYGNRIYHAYNSRHEIMEYCTEDGKEKPLGIFGTNLSVYKNMLYYIAEDGLSIHAYDLATCTDSVWIAGEEVDTLLPEPTYQYPRISDLIVTDYGMCMLYGSTDMFFVHLNYDKSLVYSIFACDAGIAELIPTSNTLIAITQGYPHALCSYDINAESYEVIDFEQLPFHTISTGNNSFLYYNLNDENFYQYDLLSKESSSLYVPTPNPYENAFYIYNDIMFYSNLNYIEEQITFWRFSINKKVLTQIDIDSMIYCLSFASNDTVYGIAYNPFSNKETKFFRADLDFKSITYLD